MKHRLSFVAAVTLAAALSALAICAVPAGAGTCATLARPIPQSGAAA